MVHFVQLRQVTDNPEFDSVLDVRPEEVAECRGRLVLVDVRQPEEYRGELGHIPGSLLVPLDKLLGELDQLPKGETIVFICRSGARSARAASFALASGFLSVYNMLGGMILWNRCELPTEGKNEAEA